MNETISSTAIESRLSVVLISVISSEASSGRKAEYVA